MKLQSKLLLVLMVLIVSSFSVYAGTQFPDEIWFIQARDGSWMGSERGSLKGYITIWYGEEGPVAKVRGCVYFNREPLLFLWGERQDSEAQGEWESITPPSSSEKGSWKAVFKEDPYCKECGLVSALLTFTKGGKTTEMSGERRFPPYRAKEIAPVPKKD